MYDLQGETDVLPAMPVALGEPFGPVHFIADVGGQTSRFFTAPVASSNVTLTAWSPNHSTCTTLARPPGDRPRTRANRP